MDSSIKHGDGDPYMSDMSTHNWKRKRVEGSRELLNKNIYG
jgi:hypothetical protein